MLREYVQSFGRSLVAPSARLAPCAACCRATTSTPPAGSSADQSTPTPLEEEPQPVRPWLRALEATQQAVARRCVACTTCATLHAYLLLPRSSRALNAWRFESNYFVCAVVALCRFRGTAPWQGTSGCSAPHAHIGRGRLAVEQLSSRASRERLRKGYNDLSSAA